MISAKHPSNSAVQKDAEAAIVAAFSKKYEVALLDDLSSTRIDVGSGAYVQVDAVTRDHTVVLEAYARQGKLKGAQLKKIAQDILKLALVKKVRGARPTEAYVVFASEEAKTSISGWLLSAATTYGIELVTVEIDDDLRADINRAQGLQVMVNGAALADDVALPE